MVFLETPHLVIQSPSQNDLDHWHALHADPTVMHFLGGPRDRETVAAWLENEILHYQKHQFCIASVYEKKSQAFIGRAGLVYLDHDDTQEEIEIGYVLHQAYWHKGYATELVRALITWAFQNLPVNKLVAVAKPDNLKSHAVLTRAGMNFVKEIIFHDDLFFYFEIWR